MGVFRSLHRSFLIFFAVVLVSVVTLVHVTVNTIVAEQSRKQQQSLSPAFSLLVEQLLEPLHIAQTLAKTNDVEQLLTQPDIDNDTIKKRLSDMQDKFSLSFFVAREKDRTQLNSDGSEMPLIEGDVSWYFKYKDTAQPVVADVGKWEDTHIYYDLRMFDGEGEFAGFFGVGKSLTSFLNVFESYKAQYGYDFVFVDTDSNITLSSIAKLNPKLSAMIPLAEVDWYAAAIDRENPDQSLHNEIIQFGDGDALVAQLALKDLGWNLYLLTPLNSQQAQVSNTFMLSVATLLTLLFLLFFLIYHLLYNVKQDLVRRGQIDPLTRLPNRNKVVIKYGDIMQSARTVSVLLIDLDNFSAVNQVHGTKSGDQVLGQIADYLRSQIRDEDVMGRWAGETFIVLLPETTADQAVEVAQKLRRQLASLVASTGTMPLRVTASIGVSHSQDPTTLESLVANAEDAVIRAKQEGRNQVRVQSTAAA